MAKEILVLGSGCLECVRLAELVEETAKSLGIAYELYRFSNPKAIVGFGDFLIPVLVVDGEVKCAGRVPSVEELKQMLA